ncbi:MAG: putative hydrolase/acyltransferase [Glaciihabitans sp.]|nr:putative hydrolase/acyltransferase [Glaciihabitans sp.]MDQ1555959.1 hypothetical protein [Actinomycetota bacterium]
MNWFQRQVSSRWFDYGWAYRLRVSILRDRHDPHSYLGGDRRPVLVLPGVYETWHFLEPVARDLHELGHPVHVVPTFGHNLLPITEMTELARRYIVEQDLTRIAIVGHSKGGLIGKALMLTDEGAARVDTMVAINSPFGGSAYAHLLRAVRPLREFVPTHDTIVTLAENAEINSRITSVYSAWDPIIPNGSALDGATNIELPVTGHFRILDRDDLLEVVRGAISAA